ncbi:Gfo/Idh/MocA family protein [Frigoribacterium sp. Leaf8]|uniref:Gfo/Idh/MocA family protein n=1 Tax=Frigoribacterium sp. Leaf8 TaxID=1735673 RepID=UPI0009EB2FF2|nr:Gfo/Idh/MocA family oxidoreductase [Frigoribacterium sp. Leaf8]
MSPQTPSTPSTPSFPASTAVPLRGGPVLRWGVIGPGEIAGDFTDALHAHTDQRVVAVASRSLDRAEAFARAHGVDTAHGDAEALVASPDVDVVYVATPHTRHLPDALTAIRAGKHVLIEKPMATSTAEADEIVAAASAAGVLAMEALWTRYLPHTTVIAELLAEGAIGDVRLATADVAWANDLSAGGRMTDPALGGGALLDIGVYAFWFTQFATGHPVEWHATGSTRADGVDLDAAVVTRTADGVLATAATSLLTTSPGLGTISGTTGSIRTLQNLVFPATFELTTGRGSAVWNDPTVPTGRQGLAYQATALASYVDAGLRDSPLHSLADSRSLLATIEATRASLTVV